MICIFRNIIAIVYTDLVGVQVKVEACLVIIAFGQLVNQTQATQQGIIRGLGQVQTATVIALVSYYGFAITLAYLYTFKVGNAGHGYGVAGLWYGMFSGQFVLVASY